MCSIIRITNFCFITLTAFFVQLSVSSAYAQPTSTAAVLRPSAIASAARPPMRYMLIPRQWDNKVSVIDTVTVSEVARLSTGIEPTYVTMSPDGRYAYVVHEPQATIPVGGGLYRNQIVISKVSFLSLSVIQSVVVLTDNGTDSSPVGAVDFEIAPDGRQLSLLSFYKSTLYTIDPATLAVTGSRVMCTVCNGITVPVGAPGQISYSNDSSRIAVTIGYELLHQTVSAANLSTVSLAPINPPPPSSGYSPLEHVRVGGFNDYVATSIPGQDVWIFNEAAGAGFQLPNTLVPGFHGFGDMEVVKDNGLFLLILGNSSFSSFDTDTLKVFDFNNWSSFEIPVAEAPNKVVYNKQRKELWAFCISESPFQPGCLPYEVDIFSTVTGQHTRMIGTHNLRHSIYTSPPAFSHDGSKVFLKGPIQAGQDTVLVIDAVTRQEISVIPLGPAGQIGPRGIFRQGDSNPRQLVG